MNRMKKIFIWGSCVSRDCFNYPSSFEVVAYHARCSCVSAMSKPVPLAGINLNNIESKFKRKAIINDFQKQLLYDLQVIDFDILLIDFIDERFPLKIDAEGRVITVSAELQETGAVLLDNNLIYVNDEKRFSLWCEAWDKFMSFCMKLGIKDKIVINRPYWAGHMENNKKIYKFTQNYIKKNNCFLNRIYSTIEKYIPKMQFIDYPDKFIIANSKHRWNISPFHYIDDFYNYTNQRLSSITSIPSALKDRVYNEFIKYSIEDMKNNVVRFITNGQQGSIVDSVPIQFTSKDKYYYFRAILPNKIYGNGLAITFRIKGWKEGYNYSIGYLYNGKHYKIKGKHLLDDHWYTIAYSKHDLIFKLDNPDAENNIDVLQDIRFILCGDFDKKASIEIRYIYVWQELEKMEEYLSLQNAPIEDRTILLNKIASYIREFNPDAGDQYDNFRLRGSMPISKINLNWQVEQKFPEHFWEVGTFSWSWLCLHPVQLCALRAYDKRDIGALCAAREFTASWLDHFFTNEKAFSMEWHEHAVAERTISLLFLYLLGQEYFFDWRIMSRIKISVILHARLLCSEAFYVRHQQIRFHNHGMFQDMALMLAGMIFAELPGAEHWRFIATERLKDMLNAIYPLDGNFRISYENSFGYHCAGYTLIERLARLMPSSRDEAYFLQEAQKIQSWTNLLRYSTRQFPAFGDTFRSGTGERYSHTTRPDKNFQLMEKSGYAVLHGYHEDSFFTLVFIASSLSFTHKHCDNLSFILYFDGIEWLIDPSFYNHEYTKGISRYLRSPEAHNSLYIPDINYSLAPGLCTLKGMSDGNVFKIYGEHHCYENILISRTITGNLNNLCLKITDSVHPSSFDIRMRLHCGEKINTMATSEGICLSHPESQYMLFIRCPQQCTTLYGQQNGGIAGTNFCSYSKINSLEFDCFGLDIINWSIDVIKK